MNMLYRLSFLMFLSGCAIGPDYERPQMEIPENWESNQNQTKSQVDLAELKWWDNFDDPDLSWMVGEIFKQNLDIKESLARIREARAQYWSTTAGLLPTVDGNASYKHNVNSLNEAFGGRSGLRLRENDSFIAGLDAAWEIDLFGRTFRASEAADALYESEIANSQDVMISVVSEAATNYMNLRRDQELEVLLDKKSKLLGENLALYENLYTAGLIDYSALLAQKNALDLANSDLANVKRDLNTGLHNIAILMGLPPQNVPERLRTLKKIPRIKTEVFLGIPSELIERRPDIRKAEDALRSETAKIGVFMGELLPKLTLMGDTTYRSKKGSNLFKKDSFSAAYGPSITWSIMDFGKIRADIRAQEALRDQQMYQFQKILLTALGDVENALLAVKASETTVENSSSIYISNSEQLDLANSRYDAGISNLQDLISQHISTIDSEADLKQAEASLSVSTISLYKALGGGWKGVATQ